MLADGSIRRQLTFWLIVPLSVALVISALVAHKLATDFVTQAYDRSLYDAALDISRRLRLRDGRLSIDLPPAAADMLEIDDLDTVYFEVRAVDGEFAAGRRGLPSPPDTQNRRPQYYYGRFAEQSLRFIALRVSYDPDDEDRLGLVIVGQTLIKRQALAQEILTAVALSQLALSFMMAIAVYLGVGHGLLPLDRLRRQIESRSHRDLSALSDAHTPHEVRSVVAAINALMLRLQRAIASQQRFIADAAHQLRTPLAGLKMHAELALRETSLNGARERIRTLIQAADRSARLVNQLLSLARAEPDASAIPDLRLLDLNAVAREVTAEWVPRAIQADIDLGFSPSAHSTEIRGNVVLLREAIVNLIDNAIRYNQRGGHITVATRTEANHVELRVEDDGPGIPVHERERVFERFQRLDGSAADGCGLGLSIVREIAQMHEAQVSIADGAAGLGVTVTVRFPLAEADASATSTTNPAATRTAAA